MVRGLREAKSVNYWLFALGCLVVLAGALDALWTTLWVDGHSGPISRSMAAGLIKLLRVLAGNKRRGLFILSGPIMQGAVLALWVALLWAGWTIVFAAEPAALIDALGRHRPIGLEARAYYVAYTMSTMGNGDY